jgi:hypothetical protein
MYSYYIPKTRDEFIGDVLDPVNEIEDEDNNNKEHHNTSCSTSSIISIILFLGTVIFLGFLVYSIIKYNTDEVREACPSLMIFIIVRTVIGLLVVASLATFLKCNVIGDESYHNSSVPIILFSSALVYFLAFCISGALVLSGSMINNSKCSTLLNDSNFQFPILGVLGWIYVACDGIFTIFFTYFFFRKICMIREPNSEEETQSML